MNREHAILGADRCVAVSPSDTAPALIALDAQMVVRRRDGERVIEAADYFQGPDIDITRMTVLQPGELLTAIRIPAAWPGRGTLREGARPPGGLPARQRRGLHQGNRRPHQRRASSSAPSPPGRCACAPSSRP
ncbi:MAG: FAD binding domain-containing protein [Vicinamibacterales bacterium]